MSLLVVYVFVMLVYIFTLPPNHYSLIAKTPVHTDVFGKTNNAGAGGIAFHRGIRSSIENKNKIVIPAQSASILFFLFVLGSLSLLISSKKGIRYLNALYSPHTDVWLSLRAIRI